MDSEIQLASTPQALPGFSMLHTATLIEKLVRVWDETRLSLGSSSLHSMVCSEVDLALGS